MRGDWINGLFEGIGGVLTWLNVWRLWQDKSIKGVSWATWAFWAAWGIWNLWYYPSLDQWWSFVGGLIVVSGNVTWVVLGWRYRK